MGWTEVRLKVRQRMDSQTWAEYAVVNLEGNYFLLMVSSSAVSLVLQIVFVHLLLLLIKSTNAFLSFYFYSLFVMVFPEFLLSCFLKFIQLIVFFTFLDLSLYGYQTMCNILLCANYVPVIVLLFSLCDRKLSCFYPQCRMFRLRALSAVSLGLAQLSRRYHSGTSRGSGQRRLMLAALAGVTGVSASTGLLWKRYVPDL